jgi:hypothetical protein
MEGQGFKPKAGSIFLTEEEVVKWPRLEKVGTPLKVHGLNPCLKHCSLRGLMAQWTR